MSKKYEGPQHKTKVKDKNGNMVTRVVGSNKNTQNYSKNLPPTVRQDWSPEGGPDQPPNIPPAGAAQKLPEAKPTVETAARLYYDKMSEESKARVHTLNMAVAGKSDEEAKQVARLRDNMYATPYNNRGNLVPVVAKDSEGNLYGYLPNTKLQVKIVPNEGEPVSHNGTPSRRCVLYYAVDDGGEALSYRKNESRIVYVPERVFSEESVESRYPNGWMFT